LEWILFIVIIITAFTYLFLYYILYHYVSIFNYREGVGYTLSLLVGDFLISVKNS
jgi:hypothetical protein